MLDFVDGCKNILLLRVFASTAPIKRTSSRHSGFENLVGLSSLHLCDSTRHLPAFTFVAKQADSVRRVRILVKY